MHATGIAMVCMSHPTCCSVERKLIASCWLARMRAGLPFSRVYPRPLCKRHCLQYSTHQHRQVSLRGRRCMPPQQPPAPQMPCIDVKTRYMSHDCCSNASSAVVLSSIWGWMCADVISEFNEQCASACSSAVLVFKNRNTHRS